MRGQLEAGGGWTTMVLDWREDTDTLPLRNSNSLSCSSPPRRAGGGGGGGGEFIHSARFFEPGFISRAGVRLPTPEVWHRPSLDDDEASGWSRDRADPPFDVSRLDGGGAGLYTFLLPVQSIPGAGEGLHRQAGG